jgi:6-pyruvoyltetrahydropterin/6-carboxytetrahydropterin synthase
MKIKNTSPKLTFTSEKVFDGYSTCFRQWKAEGTHCKFLHGYGVSFKVWFKGELDEKNWVWDFGGMKRAVGNIQGMSPSDYFKWLLDHTVIIAEDDPEMTHFAKLNSAGIIQLRVLKSVGAERFAEFLFGKINTFVESETKGRVKVEKLEFREHSKNSATCYAE